MEQKFTDGNMADVIRIGDRVHKQKGPWWDATRQVLNHLEQVGNPWSPRVLGEREDTAELSFIAGETIEASLEGNMDTGLLQIIGRRIRELHDSLATFTLAGGTEVVPWPVELNDKLIVCHNDLSPWNTVMKDGEFQGFIDWDLVSVATREWDLAWACWRFAPIYPTGARINFTAREQADRCGILLDAYGRKAINLHGFVDLIDMRMDCGLESVEVLGAQGVPGFDRLLATGMHLGAHDDRDWLAANRDVFVNTIESGT